MGNHALHSNPDDSGLGEIMKFTYIGEDERTFPTLGITVTKGDVFEAPTDFVAHNVVKQQSKATPAPTAGE